jgi:poly(A) polymerase
VEPTIVERADHPVSRRDIDPNVLRVLYRLISAGHTAYLVGGGVRDLMLGRQPKDFDVATSAHPQQVRELFRNSRLIGRRFRLVHVFFGAQNVEVATFRRRSEELLDGNDPLIRHDNTFGTAEEDAFRRDFTVNGLFYDPGSFRVFDYVEGVADLRAGLIRTIGDPELRMREDPVRMIRAVRFAVKLNFTIEAATQSAIERNRADLAKASIPRLVEETYRTLSLGEGHRALVLLYRLGLLDTLAPFLASGLDACETIETSRIVQNLAVMGQAIARGEECSRPLLLALLFSDFYLSGPREQSRERLLTLVAALRSRGYAKSDTEQMRLLLDALIHLMTRSRILRRIARRPYFGEVRRLFELIAPEAARSLPTLEDLLAAPMRTAAALSPTRRRRRRRRGGRRRHNKSDRLLESSPSELVLNDDTPGADPVLAPQEKLPDSAHPTAAKVSA